MPVDDRIVYSESVLSPLKDTNDEMFAVGVVYRDITARKEAEREREKLIAELRGALGRVRTLSGLLPICASCKKIRDDKGYWNQIESFIRRHSDADFSHSICPECTQKLYPDLDLPKVSK